MPLLEPKLPTLRRYGLDLETWKRMADFYGHACAVCKQEPTKGRLCIDHEHVKGWKKMSPAMRRTFVRGLACFRCNTTYLGRGISIERSRAVTNYLVSYEERRPVGELIPGTKTKMQWTVPAIHELHPESWMDHLTRGARNAQ